MSGLGVITENSEAIRADFAKAQLPEIEVRDGWQPSPTGQRPVLPRSRVRCPEKKKPRHLKQVAGFWRRPTDSIAPAHSAERLPVYVARRPAAPFSYGRALSGVAEK